ncbi:MAG TPA: T9SS type A sorting domain-containing protein [Candidatus Marinimicrobia bacterium]|nr:T9SS type A sorting domain-containing protein [Candidatus Neomarinimicrobiota bacterium]
MKIIHHLTFTILCLVVAKQALAIDQFDRIAADESYWQALVAVKNDLRPSRELLKQPTVGYKDLRPTLPFSYRSAQGHFLIHYTLEGNDAVDATITNADGVPDFVYETARAAERAYSLLIDTLDFQPPPIDDESTPEIDFYIINLGGAAYAYTYNENPVQSTPDRPYDYTAYTVIDNDFAGYPTIGLNGLRVTVAHEFFHVVQLGYNWWENNGLTNSGGGRTSADDYFLEWCSTWFEERAYPEVNDYLFYVGAFFNSPLKSLWNYDYAYALGAFLRFMLDRYGENLLVKVWEEIKTNYAFESLQAVLADDYNADLADLWNEFYLRCYFTGERYDPDWALSSDAMQFPLLQIPATNKVVFTESAVFTPSIEPFACVPYQVVFDQNWLCGINVNSSTPENFLGRYLFIKNQTGKIAETLSLNQNLLVGNAANNDSLLIFMTNSSKATTPNLTVTISEVSDEFRIASTIKNVYPNPYSPGKSENLIVDLQVGQIVNSIKTNWFDLTGRNVFQKNFDNGLIKIGNYSLSFSSDELRQAQLASGVYIMQIAIGSKNLTRKILLLK